MSVASKLKTGYVFFRLVLNLIPQLINVYRNREELEAIGDDMKACPDCEPLIPCDEHSDEMDQYL